MPLLAGDAMKPLLLAAETTKVVGCFGGNVVVARLNTLRNIGRGRGQKEVADLLAESRVLEGAVWTSQEK